MSAPRVRVSAVVMGASSGGVEALSVLLPALPASLAVPVFIVIHLPAGRRSLLPEIFGARCTRPVREAEDKEPIVPGCVYVAPADYHLLVDDGPQLALSADEPVHYSRPSIDVLFESAAQAYGAGLLGILLTGASEDGAAGLSAVRAAGGRTIVQDPTEAVAPVGVQAALRRDAAERVLPLGGIGAVLNTL